MKKVLAIAATCLALGTGVAFAVKPTPYKVICHHNPGNEVTLSFANEQAYNGHLGTPHNTEVYDTEGACVEVTPSVTPTGEPSVTPTGEVTPTPSVDVTPTPTATPTGTVTNNTTNNTTNNVTNNEVKRETVVPEAAPATGRGR